MTKSNYIFLCNFITNRISIIFYYTKHIGYYHTKQIRLIQYPYNQLIIFFAKKKKEIDKYSSINFSVSINNNIIISFIV